MISSRRYPKDIFNTDICGGLPEVIHRMPVDSRPGLIQLLTALPAHWHEGRIEGTRCRGNVEIRTLEWSRGKVKAVLRSTEAPNH